MKTLFLTGFMGSGKTTIGKELANQFNIPVIDTDEEIVKFEGMSVTTIFNEKGEKYFRELETRILFTMPKSNAIVTTGGGMILKQENREWMKQFGVLIYLRCDFEVLWGRLEKDRTRPLVTNRSKEETETLYHSRTPFYMDSDFIVDVSNLSVKETVNEIIGKVKK